MKYELAVRQQENRQNVANSLRPIAIILLLATLLRLYHLGAESLWVDEHFSIRDAINLKLGTRPLYYLLLHFWMKFGGSDADVWLRAFSTPFSIATVWLTYNLAQRLVSETAARTAAFMAAVSPLFVGYGQEIRMYALSTFLTLAGTILLVRMLETPSRSKVTAWAVMRWLAIITTPLNITLLLPDLLICVWQFRRQLRWLWTVGCALLFIGAATAPIVLVLTTKTPQFMADWVSYQPKPNLLRIGGMLTEFTMFWPITDFPRGNELNLSLESIGQLELIWFFYLLPRAMVCVLFALGIYKALAALLDSQHSPKLLWVAAWGLLPALFLLLVSYIASTLWFARYLLFVAPYCLIVLAATFEYCWNSHRKFAITIAAVYLIAVMGGLFHYYTTLYHDDWKGIAQVIQANEQPEDVIGLYPRDWEPEYTLPRYYLGTLPIKVMAGEPPQLKDEPVRPFIESMLDTLPPTEGRYWIVVYYPHPYVIQTLNEVIEERYTVLQSELFPNSVNDAIRLYLVDPQKAVPVSVQPDLARGGTSIVESFNE